jgi:hypothetical protein
VEGEELPDKSAAWQEATAIAGELIKDLELAACRGTIHTVRDSVGVSRPQYDTPATASVLARTLGPFLLAPMKRPPTEAALTSVVPGEARSSAPSFPALIPVAVRL